MLHELRRYLFLGVGEWSFPETTGHMQAFFSSAVMACRTDGVTVERRVLASSHSSDI